MCYSGKCKHEQPMGDCSLKYGQEQCPESVSEFTPGPWESEVLNLHMAWIKFQSHFANDECCQFSKEQVKSIIDFDIIMNRLFNKATGRKP